MYLGLIREGEGMGMVAKFQMEGRVMPIFLRRKAPLVNLTTQESVYLGRIWNLQRLQQPPPLRTGTRPF